MASRSLPSRGPAFPVFDARGFAFELLAAGGRVALRILGGGMIAFAVFLFFAIFSYSAADPSWNTAADPMGPAGMANWMGARGAFVADFLLQFVGLSALATVIWLSVTGLWLLRGQERPVSVPRSFAFLVAALVLFAVAFARVPSFGFVPQPYLGGAIGMSLLNGLAGLLQPYVGTFIHLVVAGLAFVAGAMCLLRAVGVSLRHAGLAFIAGMVMGAQGAAFAFFLVRERIALWRGGAALPDEPRRRRVSRPPSSPEEDGDDLDEDMDAEDAVVSASPRRSAASIKVVRPAAKKTRSKSAGRQMELGEEVDDFQLPDPELLQEPPAPNAADQVDENALRKNAEMLQGVLSDYNVRGDIVSIHPGPVVTLYELEPAPGTKSSRVIGLSGDIARSMAAVSVRAAVVPGRNVIGIEIPNKKRQVVYLRELLTSEAFAASTAKLGLILGKDIGGQPIIADLARMPHLLVAGTTGSGKSVAINTMILSLVYRMTPQQCRFIMIDPKMLELSVYDDIPHLLSPVVTEPGKAVVALKWAVQEMENRYRAMSKLGVRNIEGYNARLAEARGRGEVLLRKVQTGFDPDTGQPVYEEQPLDLTELPYIVVVVDEFADLMLVAGKDVENAIQRLAQMARAAGIHLIMATQRPSVDVITGVIKANFPTRISFQVTSKIDSRTILGDGGAEQLLGMGDMLYMAPGGRMMRVHGPFVADAEVEAVVDHLKAQGEPAYLEDVTEGELFGDAAEGDGAGGSGDDLYDQAVALVAREGKASTSFIQRHLQIGYNRAARIVEEMERQGVVGPANHVGKREVLVGDHSRY